VNVAHRDIGGLVPGSSDLKVQQTKAKERAKGGKYARRINQRKNALATSMKSFKCFFLQIIFYPPIFSFFPLFCFLQFLSYSSSLAILFLLSIQHKVHVGSINNEARNVSLTPTSQVEIMDDCYAQNGGTSSNQL
jgi:hypothetical protein